MSRALRLLVKDGWYHVTARGNERRAIFRGDGDCAQFLAMLGDLAAQQKPLKAIAPLA
jgi:REP element-mobilizing transposase RayT